MVIVLVDIKYQLVSSIKYGLSTLHRESMEYVLNGVLVQEQQDMTRLTTLE